MVTTYSSDPLMTASTSQVNWTIVYYAVTTSVNILTTLLIIIRILSVGGLKRVRTYRGILGILIKSAFLHSATYMVFLGLYARDTALPYWRVSNCRERA
ncbi:hypothetical protein CPB85DRAFT_604746 [Mucidula mucida]|nr:hypothetical protein CPB85DRAFT_604746 [Mucidula mucida]